MQGFVIGSDHGGFALKERLKALLDERGIPVLDRGCFCVESCDYPDFGREVAGEVSGTEGLRGVLVCTTGIGMSITANRFPGVRAALCHNAEAAKMSRAHNDANVLVLGARFVDESDVPAILDAFLDTPFEGGRHLRRVRKIEANNQGETLDR